MKARALIEVVFVFALTLFLVALAGLSPVAARVRLASNRVFVEYAVMIAVPLIILLATRRNLECYGLSTRDLRYHLNIAAAVFVPWAILDSLAGLINYRAWWGALIISGAQIVLLFVLGWLLKRKPTRSETGTLIGAAVIITFSNFAPKVTLVNAISALIFYVFFLALGEELLFRGYIQSRLNETWGKPFQFFGVHYGWGIVIASMLFGLMHVLNIASLVAGSWHLQWWWGLWTFFAGLVLGFLREKTGSIVAPTIVHGLPQGIAYAILGM